MENRDTPLRFRVSPSELERIHEKMEKMGISNRSAYLRKMALDGYCVDLDFDSLKRTATLLGHCSGNLNQYAKRANESGSVYAADIEDLQDRLRDIQYVQKEIMRKMAAIS